jgi:hypothetical protein
MYRTRCAQALLIKIYPTNCSLITCVILTSLSTLFAKTHYLVDGQRLLGLS